MEQKKPRAKAAAAAPAARDRKSAPRHTKRQQGDVIFALDIGTRTVVGVLAEKSSNGYKILDMETAAHDKRSMSDGQIEDIEAVAKVVKTVKSALERRQSIKLARVSIAAAGRALKTLRGKAERDVSGRSAVTADDLRTAELDAVRVTEENFSSGDDDTAFYCVGHSVVSVELDGYRVNKPEGHRGEKLVVEVIAAFLPAYVVDGLCAAVDIAGLEVAGLTLEPIAAINAVVPPELRLINIALCDIGAGTSDVAASKDGSVAAYGMATIAGDEITEEIMKTLLVDFDTAEMIKTSAEEQTEYTDILLHKHTITSKQTAELIAPVKKLLADTVCDEILAANGDAPQAVFLVGGGSKLTGLPELIAEGLGMDISRVAVGSREVIRGITAPKTVEIGTEHATPIGIAVTASEGIKYDFTTITLNGRKIRALDTNRLTVYELCALGGIKPEQLMARSGGNLSFRLDGEAVSLRGTDMKPSQIMVNGREASLNAVVRKGDEVCVVPAVAGENAAALLSDYYDTTGLYAVRVSFFGEYRTVGDYLLINEKTAIADGDIENGDDIRRVCIKTLGDILASDGLSAGSVLLNGSLSPADTVLAEGDVITAAPEEEPAEPVKPEAAAPEPAQTPAPARENGIPITFNGMPAVFPVENGREPIFLDILAAFSDNPTDVLNNSGTVTINGRIARLNEKIHSGDVIVVE